MKDVKVDKIVIKIKDVKLELSVDEAKELRSILNDMYREPLVTSQPYPVYIERYPRYHWGTSWIDGTAQIEYRGTITISSTDQDKSNYKGGSQWESRTVENA